MKHNFKFLSMKSCARCQKIKSYSEFNRLRTKSHANYGSYCRDCRLEYSTATNNRIKAEFDALNKTCTKCDVSKPLTEYYPHKSSKGGYAAHCRQCQQKICRSWYEKNKEKRKPQMVAYIMNNREAHNRRYLAYIQRKRANKTQQTDQLC